MAQINFTIPDDKIGRILDAFAAVYAFQPGQGQTKAQFAKSKIREHIREIVVRAEAAEAQRVAVATVQAEVDSIDIA